MIALETAITEKSVVMAIIAHEIAESTLPKIGNNLRPYRSERIPNGTRRIDVAKREIVVRIPTKTGDIPINLRYIGSTTCE
jgi:hypothetical protein